MATLYVENVPDDLYEALRSRAKARRRSIAAEVLVLLEENIPTAKELRSRREWVRKLAQLREQHAGATGTGTFPTAEEMIREDRER
jgi:plasmid stability protein